MSTGVSLAPEVATGRRVTLYCPEALRPMACCVVDALSARGFDVRLCSGAEAREALMASVNGPRDRVRVVCLNEGAAPDADVRMRRGLDPDGRGDLIVVPLSVPRDVISVVETRFGARPKGPRSATRAQRPTRAFMQPTLMETKVDRRRFGSAVLAAAAIVVGLIGGVMALDPVAPARPIGDTQTLVAGSSVAPIAPAQPEVVLSSVVAPQEVTSELDDEVVIEIEDGPEDSPAEPMVAPVHTRPPTVRDVVEDRAKTDGEAAAVAAQSSQAIGRGRLEAEPAAASVAPPVSDPTPTSDVKLPSDKDAALLEPIKAPGKAPALLDPFGPGPVSR